LDSKFAELSFERAVELFREWGFRVEEGPGDEEVTLILEGPAHRSYCVYEVDQLPQIAEAALRVRRNMKARQTHSRLYQADLSYPALRSMVN
jgi:hypothetical protein